MLKLRNICQKIFRLKSRPCQESDKSDQATQEFKTKYWNFKSLLSLNQKILENMSSMELTYSGDKIYGFGFLRKSNTELSVCLFRVITLMDRIAPGKYRALLQKFEEIQSSLNMICEIEDRRGKDASSWICMDIRELGAVDADMAGAKASNLGEIRKKAGIVIPEGFVLSCRAFRLFMEKNLLEPHVEQIIQCIDFDNLTLVYEASERLKKMIEGSPVPDEILIPLNLAYQEMVKSQGREIIFAVRSSATGEDGLKTSYAGQYLSILDVPGEDLSTAYKKVLASKYNARAMIYRHNHGLCDNHVSMCVAFLVMQDAVSSGVIYTRNPETGAQEVVISSLRGLPKSLVDGSANPDVFIYSRDQARIISREIHEQKSMLTHIPGKGMGKVDLDSISAVQPSISENLALKLAEAALELEEHFQHPQDIEWCLDPQDRIVILQTRPLQTHRQDNDQTASDNAYMAFRKEILKKNIKPVLKGGITACRGVAVGKVHMVTNPGDAAQFPQGAVMVSREALPRWSTIVGRASGLITDRGSAAGHLATVAREFNVPALFNTGSATRDLAKITHVTLDAGAGEVFGEVIPYNNNEPEHKTNKMSGTPVHAALERALALIRPLNLTDPEKDEFSPEHCRTYHDILRFCHEKAVEEMFCLGSEFTGADLSGKRLVAGEPTQWWLVDIGGGFNKQIPGDKVRLSEISSQPFLKVWEGMNSLVWQGPPGADVRGLFSIMLESTMNRDLDLTGPSAFAQKNYGLISGSFCSLSCRYGYHYSVLQSLCKDLDRENYIRFGFKGGAANMDRKRLRLKLITEIMEEWDFQVTIREDVLNSSFEGGNSLETMKRLKVLGYLIVHTRQIDMVMDNKNKFASYRNKMKNDIEYISR